MILPARRSFHALGLGTGLALLASIWPQLIGVWTAFLGAMLGLWLLDAWRVWRTPPLEITRQLPSSLALGLEHKVVLTVRQASTRPLTIKVIDHIPEHLQAQGLPLHLNLPVGEYAQAIYLIKAVVRGDYHFKYIQLRVLSPFKFWWHDYRLNALAQLKVYPNIANIAQAALLATDNHLSQLGVRKRPRRGEGQDFHQLREYRAGDSLRQIDWKASARMNKAISREYQDERDQDIIFLIDCGHRMQAKDGELSHFDHSLNALLILSYVALRQGDAVGLLTFGESERERWLKPRKGQASLNQMLNRAYDLQPSTQAPDYSQAATRLLVQQKKRALVIIISNLRDEDTEDLLPAVQLLRKQHLVLFASMREQALDQTLATAVEQLTQAIDQAAVIHYMQQRQYNLEKLQSMGLTALDVTPQQLSSPLINRYLDIKRSGLL